MSETPSRNSRKKVAPLPWDGMLVADVYSIEVPVFFTYQKQITYLKTYGVKEDISFPDHPCRGIACMDRIATGQYIFSVVINPDLAIPSTWVHELSHIVDMLFNHLVVDPGMATTEPRAYLLSHLFEQLEEIMCSYYDRQMRRDKAAKRRALIKKELIK